MGTQGGDAGALLRRLVFKSERSLAAASAAGPGSSGGPAEPVPAAQSALLQLHSFLGVAAAGAAAGRHQTDSLLQQCTGQLHKLTVQRSKDRRGRVEQLLAQAGCPQGFKFSSPPGFDLDTKLRQSEPHKGLLACPLPARRMQLPGPSTTAAGAQQLPPRVLAEQPGNQPAPVPRRSGFQVPVKAGRPSQGAPSGGGGQHPHGSFDPRRQQQQQGYQQQQQPYQGGPPSAHYGAAAAAAGGRPQQPPPYPHHQPPHQPQPDSKWGNVPNKLARRAQDGHVGHSRQQQSGRGYGGGGRGQGYSGDEEGLNSSGDDGPGSGGGEGGEEAGGQGRSIPGFQSAKTKLIADMKKNGQQYQPGSGGPMGGGGVGGGQYGGGGRGMAPRQGLARPPGLRRPGGGVGASAGGAGGKFVPPFVRKALEAQQGGAGGEGEAEGPLSLRTLEILRLAPGEPLPEALAKLDPLLIENVCSEVMDSGGQLDWNDIAGQQTAKDLIQEVVVWPIKNPQLFTGARAPPKGILLFGPPGTGKTMLGKAIATNISAVFFSISASSLVSKWMGEGEKLVRALFAVAAHVAPSVIFIDEVDSLLSARKSDGEHESMRRLKTEILIQMEGIDPSRADRRVLLIGATNRPEELDEAARRRMPKQLYIPLPCADARRDLILRQLGPGGPIKAQLGEEELGKVVARTDGYSGSDMKMLIQEACQGPVRDAFKANGSALSQLTAEALRPVVLRDFQMAARAQKASVEPAEIERYERYNEKHGAKLAGADGEEEGEEEEW